MVLQVQQQQKPRTWRKGTIGRRKNLERWDPLIAAGVARYKGLPEDRLRRACVVYTGSKTESYTRLSIFLAVEKLASVRCPQDDLAIEKFHRRRLGIFYSSWQL